MTHKYWHGTLLYIKTVTVDGRALDDIEIPYVRMPLPLLEVTPIPHAIGSIDAVWPVSDTQYEGCGSYFGPADVGETFHIGVDVNLGCKPWRGSIFTGALNISGGILLGATLTHKPAWPDAKIMILEEPYTR